MLLVDADPQGQVALGLGFPKKVRVTLKNMLENIIMGLEFDPKEVILKHKEGVEVIPANKLLAGLDVALINVEDREKVLKEYLELLEDDYDYILIDCMPSLGMMVINALYAADSVLIPVQPQYYATDGLTELLKAVKGIKQRYNPKLEIAYIEDEKVKTTRMRPLIQDLDELPFMATDFLEELQLKHGKNVTAYLVSSRGCYKNCSFYSIAAYFDMFEGCRMRYRSVKSVFEEIKYLYQNYNIRKFCFWDDNFIIPGKRGIERCRELVELIKSLPEKISLELETRVDTISYEAISLLKEGGLRHIHIGIESMIDRDLKLYNKGVTIKQNKEALNILNELGYSTKVGSKYRIATYLICFNPLTRLEDVETLLDFFKAYDISPKKQISALQITNNTLIKEILKREGVTINKNNEWKFLDNRVEDIFIKYSNFVKDAMEKRDELRTVEKIKVFNENSKICIVVFHNIMCYIH